MFYYLIGIKGAGMTALAQVLQANGHQVIGSDISEKFFTDAILNKLEIQFYEDFSKDHITADIDCVIKSSAYQESNPEVAEAIRKDLSIKNYPEMLGEISKDYFSVSVAGTHGKTTTTAILGNILKDIELSSLVIVGSAVPGFNNQNAFIPKENPDIFVAETCEYKRNFLNFHPRMILIPSLDYDHVDYYKTLADYEKAFLELAKKLQKKDYIVLSGDYVKQEFIEKLKAENEKLNIITYGFNEDNDVIVKNHKSENGRQSAEVQLNPEAIPLKITLQIPGKHNILNAVGALCISILLNKRFGEKSFPYKKALESLENFTNTKRRFEKIGEFKKALIFDDYAHHPEEIKATLKAARDFYPDRKIIAVFQSHTYSRTQELENGFRDSLKFADEIILGPIYGSAREKESNYSSENFFKKVKEKNKNVSYFGKYEDIEEHLKKNLSEKDLVITMGAGDIWKVGADLKN